MPFTPETRAKAPSRGKCKRTLILESIQEQALLDVEPGASKEDVERAWFGFLVRESVNPESSNSSLCLRMVTERGWAALKPVGESVNFEFDNTASLADQASQVLDAVSKGDLPVDHGKQLVDSIKSLAEIIANTELKKRIEAIEESLGI